MAAIGTGPTLSDEEVRGTLATAVMAAEAGAELAISATKVARMAQEILDLRTANGLLMSAAERDDEARDTKATGQRESSTR